MTVEARKGETIAMQIATTYGFARRTVIHGIAEFRQNGLVPVFRRGLCGRRLSSLGRKCLKFGPELNDAILLFSEVLAAKRIKVSRRFIL